MLHTAFSLGFSLGGKLPCSKKRDSITPNCIVISQLEGRRHEEKMDEMSPDSDWCLVLEIASKLPHNELQGEGKDKRHTVLLSASCSIARHEN